MSLCHGYIWYVSQLWKYCSGNSISWNCRGKCVNWKELGSNGDGSEQSQHLLGLGGQTWQAVWNWGMYPVKMIAYNVGKILSFCIFRCKNLSGSQKHALRCRPQGRLFPPWWSSATITRSSLSPTSARRSSMRRSIWPSMKGRRFALRWTLRAILRK